MGSVRDVTTATPRPFGSAARATAGKGDSFDAPDGGGDSSAAVASGARRPRGARGQARASRRAQARRVSALRRLTDARAGEKARETPIMALISCLLHAVRRRRVRVRRTRLRGRRSCVRRSCVRRARARGRRREDLDGAPLRRREVGRDHPLDVGFRHRVVAIELFVQEPRVAAVDLHLGELLRAREVRLQAEEEPRADAVSELRHVRVARAEAPEIADLRLDELLHLVEARAARELDVDLEHVRPAEARHARADLDREVLLADERAVQPRALAVAEEHRREGERVVVRLAALRDDPPFEERRELRVRILDRRLAFGGLRRDRLGRVERRDLALGARVAEVLASERHRLVGVEIAGDREDRVVRRVVGVVEGAHPIELGGVEILHGPDGRVLVGPIALVDELLEAEHRGHVRRVLDAHAVLFLDDRALVFEVALRDVERLHAVGLEPEAEGELARREHLEVVRAIFARRAVERAAVARHELEVLAARHVLRALEHHVLEQVREAGAAADLVAAADVVDDVHGDGRRRVVDEHHDAQAIVELLALHVEPQIRRGGRRGGCRGRRALRRVLRRRGRRGRRRCGRSGGRSAGGRRGGFGRGRCERGEGEGRAHEGTSTRGRGARTREHDAPLSDSAAERGAMNSR